MQELRKDPIIDRWVIIATERGQRPSDFARPRLRSKDPFCAFCAGLERMTPPEILAFRESGSSPNGPGWWIRVVPNKFPALNWDREIERSGEGMYDRMSGVGAHEVVIESPSHDASYATHTDHQVEEILWSFQQRMQVLKRNPLFRYILVFIPKY